jgi:heme-degrading monooxygenase HmoA
MLPVRAKPSCAAANLAGVSPTEDDALAVTPPPPYTAVIFTSRRAAVTSGYEAMAAAMFAAVREQPGFLGVDSARDGVGITVSYWVDDDAARAWKQVAEHLVAQRLGHDLWYADYHVRVATVHRDYRAADSPRA